MTAAERDILVQASAAFICDVYDRAETIDPHGERDWYDLALGYLLAKGLPPAIVEGEPCTSLAMGKMPKACR